MQKAATKDANVRSLRCQGLPAEREVQKASYDADADVRFDVVIAVDVVDAVLVRLQARVDVCPRSQPYAIGRCSVNMVEAMCAGGMWKEMNQKTLQIPKVPF